MINFKDSDGDGDVKRDGSSEELQSVKDTSHSPSLRLNFVKG